MDTNLYDKNGYVIKPYDVLKVFHFKDRGRKHYMYKQAEEYCVLGNPETVYLRISHLYKDSSYHELANGRVLNLYEIVQGYKLNEREQHPRFTK